MSPVDGDSPVTDISPHSYQSFVKHSMCSYEEAGQPGYRDLGFYDRDLGYRDENFPIRTLRPGLTGMKKKKEKFKCNQTFP